MRLPPEGGCLAICLLLELWGVTRVFAEHRGIPLPATPDDRTIPFLIASPLPRMGATQKVFCAVDVQHARFAQTGADGCKPIRCKAQAEG